MFDAKGDGYDDLTCHTSNETITISESHIVEQRTGGVSMKQTTSGTNVEQTTAGVNVEQTTAGVNVEQTTATGYSAATGQIANRIS